MAKRKRTPVAGGGKKAAAASTAAASTAVGPRHASASASWSHVRQPDFSPSANVQESEVSRQKYDVAPLMRGEDPASSGDAPVVQRAKRTLGALLKA